MKKVPTILVMGRPNVGKSTFINRLLKKKSSITSDMPGVTRDIVSYPAKVGQKSFLLLDSGGIWLSAKQESWIQDQIEALVEEAIHSAMKIVFLVDTMHGIDPIDQDIARLLRPISEKVVLVANKMDSEEQHIRLHEFRSLGFGEPFGLSAMNGFKVKEFFNELVQDLPIVSDVESIKQAYNISIVGRPNVGKSSLINAILNEDRVIVSDEAGTTRDTVQVYYQHKGDDYVFVDTAGLRRKSKVEDGVEYYSTLRSNRAIENSDLVVVVIDAYKGITNQDKKIIVSVLESQKNLIVFLNKWDLTKRTDQLRTEYIALICSELPVLENYPFIFGSALEKHQLGKLFSLIPTVIESGKHRIPTGELNQFVNNIMRHNPPSSKYSKKVKIYYASQVSTMPPTFVFFVNHLDWMSQDYTRFIENQIREYLYPFKGNPIQIIFRSHRD